MAHTDIVKARAIRRAGHACEVCGTPVRFKSARFLEVRPLFGLMFEAEECCVLCERCWTDVDREQREGGERPPLLDEILGEMDEELGQDDAGAGDHTVKQGPWGERPPQQQERPRLLSREEVLRAARDSWFTDDDPDGGRCA